jgi:hypothetical protein
MVFTSILALVPAWASLALAFTQPSSPASPFDPCPVHCSKAGHAPSAWTHLHGERALKRCNQTMLFDTAIYVPVDAPDAHVTFRACKASEVETQQPIPYVPTPFVFDEPGAPGSSTARRRQAGPSSSSSSSGDARGCVAGASTYRNTTRADFQRWSPRDGGAALAAAEHILSATAELESWLASEDDCGSSIM